MNNTHSGLIEGYLEDLARRLEGLPPEDRMEVLDGVREHIDSALTELPDPAEAKIQAVLAELGPPAAVAREAFAGRPGEFGAAAGGGTEGSRPLTQPLASRGWVPVLVAVLQGLGILFAVVVIPASLAFVTTTADSSGVAESRYDGVAIGAMLSGGMVVLPFWIVLALLVGNSGLWSSREKVVHLLLLPVALLLVGVLPEIGYAVVGEVTAVFVAAWVAMAVAVFGGGWLVVRLTRAGRRRVRT